MLLSLLLLITVNAAVTVRAAVLCSRPPLSLHLPAVWKADSKRSHENPRRSESAFRGCAQCSVMRSCTQSHHLAGIRFLDKGLVWKLLAHPLCHLCDLHECWCGSFDTTSVHMSNPPPLPPPAPSVASRGMCLNKLLNVIDSLYQKFTPCPCVSLSLLILWF